MDEALWSRLAAHEIGPADARLTFAARLERENRWSEDYTLRVIGEYKRFCYLAVTAEHPVTPSDQIDQAWHLHLTYSRDYWQTFCPEVLGRDLHHGPTTGSEADRARYFEDYAQTLKSYEALWGTPPADIWSPAAERFGRQTRAFRVFPDRVIFLKDRGGIASFIFMMVVLLGLGFALGKLL